MDRVRGNLRGRAHLPSTTHYETDAVRAERLKLAAEIEDLRDRMSRVGDLGARPPGWRGRAVWFTKRVVRKLARRHLDQQRDVNAAILGLLERAARILEDTGQIVEKSARLAGHRDELDVIHERLDALGSAEDVAVLATRVHRLSKAVRSATTLPSHNVASSARVFRAEGLPFDYFSFERKFRGSFVEIKRRQREYLRTVTLRDAPVLDLGCGRGEFVELLNEEGIAARGVDLNEDAVTYAQERGLPVQLGDAFETLRAADDDSLGGVAAFHLVEHLEPGSMIELLSLAYDKLRKGGSLIVETPNPQCLLIFAESFYLDLTHVRPVHPQTLEHLLEGFGFSCVKLAYSSPAVDLHLPPLRGPIDNLREFNEALARVNRALFGFRDYAAIATK
jgi:O-antigen chain-terminating methyltransferase